MTLRWRLTLSTVALITPLLLILSIFYYYNLRNFLLDREAVRLRAQAKPIIDEELLNQSVDESKLRSVANQLATDLTSAETGAMIVDRNGVVIGRHWSKIGEPTSPELPKHWYAPALAGKLEQNYIVRDANQIPTLVVLVPIPPRQKPLGVAVLSTSLEQRFREIRQHVFSTLLVSSIALVIAAALVFWMVRVQLRPLERMIAVADRIARGDWSQRMQLPQGRDEIGLLARSLDEMVDHLQAAFEVQSQTESRLRQFLADVSHELRTPLTAIGGYVDLLLQGVAGTPGPGKPLLRAMRREINRTSRLVKDLLLLARSDRAALFDLKPVDLSSLCAEVAEQVRLIMGDRTLQLDLMPHVVVMGDADRLEQVLLNLLDNAIRHTPAGTQIELRLEKMTVPTGNTKAQITIADTGPGIPPDMLDRIFERFYRRQCQRDGERGAGLGLAIAQAIVEAHGGVIQAGNQPTGGACFQVELPLDRSADR